MTIKKKKLISIFIILTIFPIFFQPTYLIFYLNSSAFPKTLTLNQQEIQIPFTEDEPIREKWLTDTDFEDDEEWKSSIDGDTSDVAADISGGSANYMILGKKNTFSVVSGVPNNTETSSGWIKVRNSDFLYPTTSEINSEGCFVYHYWHDDENQFPSVHFRNNVSVPIDMSDYTITSVSLNTIVNASVNSDIDTPNDDVTNFAIGDFVKFYVQITDLGYNTPQYTVAQNKTKYLGQQRAGYTTILNITDNPLSIANESALITALNSAFEKDPEHSNFAITLGIDVYSEDNEPGTDNDHFTSLIIKSCNLTFTCEKKINPFTIISWKQDGDEISGKNIRITGAELNFDYKVNKAWPSSAPLSEIRFRINNKKFDETIKLSNAITSFQEAGDGDFDISDYVDTDEEISLSIEVYLKDDFELDEVIIISIDDISLYIEIIEAREDTTLIVYSLISVMVGLVIVFGLYEKHFKYPPMVRKIRKLKRKIKRGRKLQKPLRLDKREIIKKKIYTKEKVLFETQAPQQIKDVKQVEISTNPGKIDKLKNDRGNKS